jgi:hypothetical protein
MHARRSGERSTTLTDVAIPTIRIRGAHKPRGNCVRKQESLSDREPRGTASGTADVSRPGQLDAVDDGNIGLVEQRNTRKPRLAQQEDTPRQPSA